MIARETSISLNETIQVIDIDNIEQMSGNREEIGIKNEIGRLILNLLFFQGVQNLNRRSNPREEAFLYRTQNHPFLSESSWSQIDRSPLQRRCRQRRRRWKLSNCFRCTSAVRDEAHNS